MATTSIRNHLAADPYLPDMSCDGIEPTMLLRGGQFAAHCELPPEHRLMIALVMDAVQCVEKYRHATDSRGKRCFDREAEWILSDDTKRLYAFARICETLDLDPAAVRRSLGLVASRRDRRPRSARRRISSRPFESRLSDGAGRRPRGISATVPS
ncbi:MAG: hypothetical protein HY899_05200 [Deltaproteobacteria bacterium]|nr:hypothetical protein [Deltaproteobacteria bacterium]